MLHHPYLAMFSGRIAAAAVIAASPIGADISGYVIIAGGVIWAFSTWRQDRRKLLADEVRDQKLRLETIEAENQRKEDALKDATHKIELLEQRPNVDGLALAIAEVGKALAVHREESAVESQKLRGTLDELATTQTALAGAIRLWATGRAQDMRG